MKSKFTGILTLFLAFFIQFSFAQEKTITGTVTSSGDGLPLPGASVVIGGTTKGTQTDLDGRYTIMANKGDKLAFTFIGMAPQTIVVGDASVINVKMATDLIIEAVTVEGYHRTTAKTLSNVAVTTVVAETIEGRPNANFIQTLQGQVPGLNITTNSGQPGANSSVILRGLGSINGNVEPLYVIDGVPLNSDNFRSLNPSDISSISVLKDAGATAIYGNRGANGVIIVTTKTGSFNSDMSIKYVASSGFVSLQKHDYNLMSSRELLTLQNQSGFANTPGANMTEAEIAAWDVNTNWQKELFRTASYQSHAISMSSGSKNLTSYTSLGYYQMDGLVRNTGLQRFNFRNNNSGRSDNGKFNYQTGITLNFSKNNETTNLGTGNVNLNPVMSSLQGLPYLDPAWYIDGQQMVDVFGGAATIPVPGGVSMAGNLGISPYLIMDRNKTFVNNENEIKGVGNLQGSYKITDDLTIGSSFGLDFTETQFLRFNAPNNWTELYFQSAGEKYLGFNSENTVRSVMLNTTTRLNYNKTFADKHTIDASIFTEYLKAHYKSMSAVQNGLDPKQAEPGNGQGWVPHDPNGSTPQLYVPSVGSAIRTAGLFSYFGTADYDYDRKYGVGVTLRRDATYRFDDEYKWGTYWAVSGRWNIDQESFMENAGFNMLKLRASYGSTGNQNIDGQSIFSSASNYKTLYGQLGSGYMNNPSYGVIQYGNPKIQWETVVQTNVGIDFVTLNRRLSGTVDYYEKVTKDMYIPFTLSAAAGTSSINANVGEMSNKGVEAMLRYELFPSTSDFQLSVTANGSYNKNTIENIASEDGRVDLTYQVNQEGRTYNEFFLVRYAGVNAANGNALFYTADGQLTEDPNEDTDRVLTGKSPLPVYQGGFGFDASYKGFFLTTQFNYVADIWRMDQDLQSLSDTGPSELHQFNKTTDLFDAWTPTNRYTSVPALAYNTGNYDVHDRFLRDASYIRLRFVSLGYDVPTKFLDKTFLDSVRVYAQGENLYTWSNWRGWDAESLRGGDYAQYPTPKIVSFGVEVKF